MKKSSRNVESNISDHENGPCFFKIMHFNGKSAHSLRIPPDFVTTHLPKRIPRKAVLKGPSGDQRWEVCIWQNQEEEGEAILKQGWNQFYQHHSLGDGEFLVFRHTGNMCFDVQIYDRSGCKRENIVISTTAQDVDEEEEEVIEISDTETEPEVQTKRKGKGKSRGRERKA